MSAARVLLVDDEQAARELLARGLRRAGFEVWTAGDGERALEQLEQPIDVVVTDLIMPVRDGLELLADLNRRSCPALRVVMTSFADKERVLAVLNLGADYLLEKPFSAEQLAVLLQRLLRERGAEPQGLAQFFQRRLQSLPLTARERELVECVLRGDSNKQIALRLALSEQTVKNALSAAYARLGVQSRGELFHHVFPI